MISRFLHNKALHYFLIGIVTGVLSALSVTASRNAFSLVGLLAPGAWVGLGLTLYCFIKNKRSHQLNFFYLLVFLVAMSFSYFLVVGYFHLIITGMPLLGLIPRQVWFFFSGLAGATLMHALYGTFVVEHDKNFNFQNLIIFAIMGAFWGSVTLRFLDYGGPMGAGFTYDLLPWVKFFVAWQAPMLAALGWMDSPRNGRQKAEYNNQGSQVKNSS